MNGLDLAIGRGVRRLGLPVTPLYHLLRARRILAHPVSYVRRRRRARTLVRQTPRRGFIPRDTGHAVLEPGTLPGVEAVVAACQRLFAERRDRDTSGGAKPFYANILKQEDLIENPELLEFALGDELNEIVTDYLGTLPRLSALGLQYSPVNETTTSSQRFHIDGDDFHQIKCFINIFDVAADDGPLSFLPAATSRRVRAGLGHGWRDGRLADDDVFRLCRADDLVTLTGTAGTGVLLDTSTCLHFGSRSRREPRVTLMCQYTPCPNLETESWRYDQDGSVLVRFPLERYADHPLKRALLRDVV